MNFIIKFRNIDDRKPIEYKFFIEYIYEKFVGYKIYIGKNLLGRLFADDIQVITKLKSNMKEALMSLSDKLIIRKRAIIDGRQRRELTLFLLHHPTIFLIPSVMDIQ